MLWIMSGTSKLNNFTVSRWVKIREKLSPISIATYAGGSSSSLESGAAQTYTIN